VIVHDFVEVECAAPDVTRALVDGAAWLAESARVAHASAADLRIRIGPGGSHAVVSKTVDLHLGKPVVLQRVTTIPVLWEATGPSALFPRLDGTIEVSPLADGLTQVSLFARYDPPLGKVGEVIDQLMLHHLAEHTVRAFLRDIAQRLRGSTGTEGHSVSPLPVGSSTSD
jgi:hypothetical protein